MGKKFGSTGDVLRNPDLFFSFSGNGEYTGYGTGNGQGLLF
jgi:hypothetical protein